MGASTFLNDYPRLHPEYREAEEACKAMGESAFHQLYKGAGIAPQDHPLNAELHIEQRNCLKCESQNLLVIYAQKTIHPMNGDEYYDLEMHCQDCKSFSIFAYSDND